MKKLLAIGMMGLVGCGSVNYTKLQDEALEFTVNDNYQTVFGRYTNHFSACRMRGWVVTPVLLTEEQTGTIRIGNAHEALVYIQASAASDSKTNVRYSNGFYFGNERVNKVIRAVGEGSFMCGEDFQG